ncbi:MAG: hypothetical protein M1530_01690 [Candidatus Marsarchaeota archaeon]|nr:hypothetical protein [Candidatus Marsarchaeota archaeon]
MSATCELCEKFGSCSPSKGLRPFFAREQEYRRSLENSILRHTIVIYDNQIKELFSKNPPALSFFRENISKGVKENERGPFHLRKIENPEAHSNRVAYRLDIGGQSLFLKETLCDRMLWRWGPFELVALVELGGLLSAHVGLANPRFAYSNGRTSYIITDYIPEVEAVFQPIIPASLYYGELSDFYAKARANRIGEMRVDFVYIPARDKVVLYDPLYTTCSLDFMQKLLALPEKDSRFRVNISIPEAELDPAKFM